MTTAANDSDWSSRIAALVVDALADATLLSHADFDQAVKVAQTEIQVRLSIGDRPDDANFRYKANSD